jgi:hypothetical protein
MSVSRVSASVWFPIALHSLRQFKPDVVFDPIKVTLSAFFIDPNGDRLDGGRVIGRRGQNHAYLFALARSTSPRALRMTKSMETSGASRTTE